MPHSPRLLFVGARPVLLAALAGGLAYPATLTPYRRADAAGAPRVAAADPSAATAPGATAQRSRPTLALQVGHSGPITAVVVSPDGRLIATASADRTVRLWDAATMNLQATLRDAGSPLAFSPDGKVLATGSAAGSRAGAHLWDTASGQLRATMPARVLALAFSPDGKTLLTGSAARPQAGVPVLLQRWDTATGQRVGTLTHRMGSVEALAFSPDGRTVATRGMGSILRVGALAGGPPTLTLPEAMERVTAVALSPDGRTLAAAAGNGPVQLWDAQTGRRRGTLPMARAPLAFSPDGTLLASGFGKLARLWDVRTGRLRASLAGHTAIVQALAFSPNGNLLATGSADTTARLWDVTGGRPRTVLSGHSGSVTVIAFSPDGALLATGSEDRRARVWAVPTGALKTTLPEQDGPVAALTFSPDGRMLAVGDAGRGTSSRVRIWHAGADHPGALLVDPLGAVRAAVFSADGKTLTTVDQPSGGGAEGEQAGYTIRQWEASTGRLEAARPGPPGVLTALAVSGDGRMLAVAGDVELLRLWDAATGTLQRALSLPAAAAPLPRRSAREASALVFAPDGRRLAAVNADRTTRLWDLQTGKWKSTLPAAAGDVASVAFSPDGRMLATASRATHAALVPGGRLLATGSIEPAIRFWDAATGQPRPAPASIPEGATALAFFPDGQTLATGSEDHSLRLWDVTTGAPKGTEQGSSDAALAQALSPDGRLLAVGSADSLVRLWDLTTGQLVSTLSGHAGPVRALAFSPDGERLASGSGDRTVRLWEVATSRLATLLPGHSGPVTALAFSPDGTLLAVGGGCAPRLWDTATGRLKAILQGAREPAPALAFSPDGKTLAATGRTSAFTARLWEVATGRLLTTLPGYQGPVTVVAFSPDGRLLATKAEYLSGDSTIRLWETATGQLKATLPVRPTLSRALAFSLDGGMLAAGYPAAAAASRRAPFNGSMAAAARSTLLGLWDTRTGQLAATLENPLDLVSQIAFSADGRMLAARDLNGRVAHWEVATRQPLLTTAAGEFPAEFTRPTTTAGAAVLLHHPADGRVLATLLPIPDAAVEAARAGGTGARPIPLGAKPIPLGAKPISLGAKAAGETLGEWFVATPEGYFDGSANAARFIRWNVNGVLYPAERYLRRFRRPDLVRQALRGEAIAAPEMTADDVPPTARFVGLKDGDLAPGDALTVTVEVESSHPAKAVELLVNGRPLPPELARPIAIGAKPIPVGAKSIPDRSGGGVGSRRTTRQFRFHVSLPQGAEQIRLRATAYDSADLGSDPVEIVLKRAGAKAAAGHLLVLAVGISRYRNGRTPGARAGGQFDDLRFPAADARAIAARFAREGPPLYDRVEERVLTDQQATAANVRAGLKWLQQSVRPEQIDTVVIFLSGHGISQDGHYFFPTYDLDLRHLADTSLSGAELREALGGQLRAKAVFLFVDTCHAGGLGGRNDDLALEVGEGVYVLASSGSTEYSFESPTWGHGAFTLALLRALDRPELAAEGAIRFNALAYAVPDEVAELMKAAGRSESDEEPCVPLAARRLREPLVLARR